MLKLLKVKLASCEFEFKQEGTGTGLLSFQNCGHGEEAGDWPAFTQLASFVSKTMLETSFVVIIFTNLLSVMTNSLWSLPSHSRLESLNERESQENKKSLSLLKSHLAVLLEHLIVRYGKHRGWLEKRNIKCELKWSSFGYLSTQLIF